MSKIVNRTLDVFELFAQERKPLSLTDIMKRLDIPMSSCHDIVRALETRGYLYEVQTRGGYYPTMRLYELGRAIAVHAPIVPHAEPLLQGISERFDISVFLARAKGASCTYLLVCVPSTPLRFELRPGDELRNLYATSAGKAVLAGLPVAERRQVLEKIPRPPLTSHTLTDVDDILADVAAGESRGWFKNTEESFEEALTLSVRFVWGEVAYIITAAGPMRRLERRLDEIVEAVQNAAAALGAKD